MSARYDRAALSIPGLEIGIMVIIDDLVIQSNFTSAGKDNEAINAAIEAMNFESEFMPAILADS